MRKIHIILLLFFMVYGEGCSHSLLSKKNIPVESKEEVNTALKGRILLPENLSQGGRILIVPFNAGENVAATDKLERVSLKIVKGMALVLKGKMSRFEVLTAENADRAEYRVVGHIVKMSGEKNVFNLFSKKKNHLAVEGKMINVKNQEVVLLFTDSLKADDVKTSFEFLGLTIGRELGQYILNAE